MSNEYKALVVGFLFGGLTFLALGISGKEDCQEELSQQSEYCEMVKLWNSQPGVSKYDRLGWPDYNRNYEQVCK